VNSLQVGPDSAFDWSLQARLLSQADAVTDGAGMAANMSMRVSIVGGGRGGLAAALLLAREGLHVTVFEKGDAIGGRTRTITTSGGYRFDIGPTFSSTRASWPTSSRHPASVWRTGLSSRDWTRSTTSSLRAAARSALHMIAHRWRYALVLDALGEPCL
jgi:monoamine oxidase